VSRADVPRVASPGHVLRGAQVGRSALAGRRPFVCAFVEDPDWLGGSAEDRISRTAPGAPGSRARGHTIRVTAFDPGDAFAQEASGLGGFLDVASDVNGPRFGMRASEFRVVVPGAVEYTRVAAQPKHHVLGVERESTAPDQHAEALRGSVIASGPSPASIACR